MFFDAFYLDLTILVLCTRVLDDNTENTLRATMPWTTMRRSYSSEWLARAEGSHLRRPSQN